MPREVEVAGVGAPEAGREVKGEEPVRGDAAGATAAEPRRAGETLPALAAGDERFDADPVANGDAPAPGGVLADLRDAADGLVAGDDRVADGQSAGVLLVVGAADAAGLDA